MAERVQLMALEDTFDASATLVPAGQVGTFDPARLNGKEPLVGLDGLPPVAVIEMSPLGPTGPNPTAPQQIPPDAQQGPGGTYVAPGRRLVGEVTQTADKRLTDIEATQEASTEGDLAAQLAEARRELGEFRARENQARAAAETGQPVTANQNNDDALVEGTVAEVTADLGSKTDAELESLRAAEVDREKPRKGVLDAIKAELANRQS